MADAEPLSSPLPASQQRARAGRRLWPVAGTGVSPLLLLPLVASLLLLFALPLHRLLLLGPSSDSPGGALLASCAGDAAPSNAQLQRAGALPTLLFLAAPEGGGHDFFERFFSYLPVNVTAELFEPELHLTADDAQKVAPEQCPRMPYARHMQDFGAQIAARLAKVPQGGVYLRARDPFPMGRVRTPLARPDLQSLALFDGVQYRLKVISIVRNLTEVVAWSVSRNFHSNDMGLQVRLIEDSMVYLDAQLRVLPCSMYAIVSLSHALKNPQTMAEPFAEFLDLPHVDGESVLRALRAARSSWLAPPLEQAAVLQGQPVQKFFDLRSPMWPLLSAARHAPFFSPAEPWHWPA